MRRCRIHRIKRSSLICAGILGFLSPAGAAERPAPDLAVGKAAYDQQCARCHGITGGGDGRDAKRLFPRPQDLTAGTFKFRSTASGTSPTDDDLFETLTNGLTAGGMPDWGHLDEALRWQLVSYLKTLSPNFESNPPQPVPLGQDPGIKHADLARGKQVYEKLGCAACHGISGRGNGSSAATLVDNWNRASRPADLTQGWNYRGGSDPRAIALRILTGIDGTPMPSYAEAASTDEVWQLAYYVRSLQQEPRWTLMARAAHVAGSLPKTSDDPRWAATERVDVRLHSVIDAAGERNAPQTVSAVSFQAMYNEEALSVRVAWHDPSEDRENPSDALALAFRPVGVAGDVVSLQTWPFPGAPKLDLCVWSANQPEAREAIAGRYESVLDAQVSMSPVASQAVYHDGEWNVVLTRPLTVSNVPGAAQLARGQFVPVAVVVWDGGNAGQQAVSTWVDLILQAPRGEAAAKRDPSIYLVWALSGVVLMVALGFVFKRSSTDSQ